MYQNNVSQFVEVFKSWFFRVRFVYKRGVLLQVIFKTPVSLKEHPKVNEWLTCVEKEMRVTLASLLAEAMKDVSLFQSENIDSQKYLEWVDKYQVNELLIFLP